MKNTKKLLTLLLAAVMMLALTACGKTDAEKMVGTWKTTVDAAPSYNASIVSSSGDDALGEMLTVDSFTFDVIYTFGADGSYSCVVDEASLETALQGIVDHSVDALYTYLEDTLNAQAALYDISLEQLLEMLGVSSMEECAELAFGGDPETMLSEMFDSIFSQEFLTSMAANGTFEMQNGVLSSTNAGVTYSESYTFVNDNTVVLDAAPGAEVSGVLADFYPLTLTRIG